MLEEKKQIKIDSNSSVERSLVILEFISAVKGPVGVGEIASALDLPKSTTHRLLEVLKYRNFIEQIEESEKYDIGIKAIEVGMSGLKNWVDIASAYARYISNELGETSFIGVFDNGEIVYVYKAEGTQSVITNAQLGTRKPIHCTALGKAIVSNFSLKEVDQILSVKGMTKYAENTITDRQSYLEELSFVRENGYAIDNEEAEVGLTCIAVPIFSYTGQVRQALSIAGPTPRMLCNKDLVIEHLKEASDNISRRLGYVPTIKKSY
jgi:IclR family KDG regulon transcriptional repressor